MEEHKTKANPAKRKALEEILSIARKYRVIGIANLENLPAKQLQGLRAAFRDIMVIRMTKKSIMRLMFEELKEEKKGVEKLEEYLTGMPSLIFSDDNPFKLFNLAKNRKSKAPAKAGQTANDDIYIEEGPTPFGPGPFIGELGQLGVKATIENGKITIKSRTLVVKAGEVISEKVAATLSRLGITPVEIGLNITVVYDDGMVIPASVLDSVDTYKEKLNIAVGEALSLSVEIAHPCRENIALLISKAQQDALSLSVEAPIFTRETAGRILLHALLAASTLKNEIKI